MKKPHKMPGWLKNFGKFVAILFVLYIAYLGLYYLVLPAPIQKPVERTSLIGLINKARAEKDVPPLTADPTLDHTAKLKAEIWPLRTITAMIQTMALNGIRS